MFVASIRLKRTWSIGDKQVYTHLAQLNHKIFSIFGMNWDMQAEWHDKMAQLARRERQKQLEEIRRKADWARTEEDETNQDI